MFGMNYYYYIICIRMASGSMLKYVQINNSELNMIEGNDDENLNELREIQEQQTIEKKKTNLQLF